MKKKNTRMAICAVLLSAMVVMLVTSCGKQTTEQSGSSVHAESSESESSAAESSMPEQFLMPALDSLSAETEDGIEIIDSELLSEIREKMQTEGEKPFLTLEDITLLQAQATALYDRGKPIILPSPAPNQATVLDPSEEADDRSNIESTILSQYVMELTPAEYIFTSRDFNKAGWVTEIYSVTTFDNMRFIPLAGDYDSPEDAFEQMLAGECAYLVFEYRYRDRLYYIYDGEPDSETFFESIHAEFSVPE